LLRRAPPGGSAVRPPPGFKNDGGKKTSHKKKTTKTKRRAPNHCARPNERQGGSQRWRLFDLIPPTKMSSNEKKENSQRRMAFAKQRGLCDKPMSRLCVWKRVGKKALLTGPARLASG
jgi:hypothetical protein